MDYRPARDEVDTPAGSRRDFRRILRKCGLSPEQALFIGDDLVDLPALRLAGLAVCPADAHFAVKNVCHWVTRMAGGRGVFREVADFVLSSQGLLKGVISRFENPSEPSSRRKPGSRVPRLVQNPVFKTGSRLSPG